MLHHGWLKLARVAWRNWRSSLFHKIQALPTPWYPIGLNYRPDIIFKGEKSAQDHRDKPGFFRSTLYFVHFTLLTLKQLINCALKQLIKGDVSKHLINGAVKTADQWRCQNSWSMARSKQLINGTVQTADQWRGPNSWSILGLATSMWLF